MPVNWNIIFGVFGIQNIRNAVDVYSFFSQSLELVCQNLAVIPIGIVFSEILSHDNTMKWPPVILEY